RWNLALPGFRFLDSAFLILTFLTGCAVPHRKAAATHTLEAFHNRPDGLVSREEWRDTEGGGGFFLFADPNVQAMTANHTNQCALGGVGREAKNSRQGIQLCCLARAKPKRPTPAWVHDGTGQDMGGLD